MFTPIPNAPYPGWRAQSTTGRQGAQRCLPDGAERLLRCEGRAAAGSFPRARPGEERRSARWLPTCLSQSWNHRPARRGSEHDFRRELDDPGRASGAEGAEVVVDLSALDVEERAGDQTGELGMVPGVEQLRPELDVASFAEQREPLVERDVPVVRAGPAENADARVAELAAPGALEGLGVEVAEEGALALVQIRVARDRDPSAFGRAGDILTVHGAECRSEGRSGDQGSDA